MRRIVSRPPFRPIGARFVFPVLLAVASTLGSGSRAFAQQTPAPTTPETPTTPVPTVAPTAPPQNQRPKPNETPAFPPSELKLPPRNAAPTATPGNVNTVELPTPLTLNQAIAAALQLQPNIAAATASREAGDQRSIAAKSRYYPFVTPTYTLIEGYNYTQVSRLVTSGTGGSVVPIGDAGTGTTTSNTTGSSTTGTVTGTGTTTGRQTGTGTGTGTGTETGTGTGTGGSNTGNGGTTGGTTIGETSEVVRQFQGTTSETRTANIGLSYRVYDSGARELNARQARQNVRQLEFNEENVRQTTIVNVADTYFAALRNAALVRVSEAQVARATNTRDVVVAQIGAGLAAAKDRYQADADLANALVNLYTSRANAANATAALKNAIGLVGGAPLVLADVPAPGENTQTTVVLDETAAQPAGTGAGAQTPASPIAPPVSSVPTTTPADEAATINRLADLAYRTRPDIAQALQGIEANQTSVSLARINTRVIVTGDVTGGLGINGREFNNTTGNNRQLNVNLSYPLFDAGLARSQVRASEATVRSSSAQLTSLRQQIGVQVEQTYRTLTVSRATLPAALSAQQAAQINYDAANEAYRLGVNSIVDVITAQTALVQAQINYVQSVYNFYTADADLARAVGQASRIAQAGASPAADTAPVTNGVNGAPASAPAAVPTPPAPVAPPAGGVKPTAVPGGPQQTPANAPVPVTPTVPAVPVAPPPTAPANPQITASAPAVPLAKPSWNLSPRSLLSGSGSGVTGK